MSAQLEKLYFIQKSKRLEIMYEMYSQLLWNSCYDIFAHIINMCTQMFTTWGCGISYNVIMKILYNKIITLLKY